MSEFQAWAMGYCLMAAIVMAVAGFSVPLWRVDRAMLIGATWPIALPYLFFRALLKP